MTYPRRCGGGGAAAARVCSPRGGGPRARAQAIPSELAAKYAADIGALFIETSAKDGSNVKVGPLLCAPQCQCAHARACGNDALLCDTIPVRECVCAGQRAAVCHNDSMRIRMRVTVSVHGAAVCHNDSMRMRMRGRTQELFRKIAAKLPSPDEAAFAEPGVDLGKREKGGGGGGGCPC